MSSLTRTAFNRSSSLQTLKTRILDQNAHYNKEVEQLLGQLGAYPDEQLNRQPAAGSWSAIQTLHHLLLVEEYSLAYVHKKLSFGPVKEKVNFGTHWRSFWLRAYLGSPFKFQAPAFVSTTNLPAFATLADTRTRWERIRQDWTDYLSQLPNDLLDKQVYRQPIAGRLGWLQTLDFFQAHFRRHRKQAWRAARPTNLSSDE